MRVAGCEEMGGLVMGREGGHRARTVEWLLIVHQCTPHTRRVLLSIPVSIVHVLSRSLALVVTMSTQSSLATWVFGRSLAWVVLRAHASVP
jgi:hypothetical protein